MRARTPVCAALAALTLLGFAGSAEAAPAANDDASYAALGRVWPDPLAGCQPGVGICSPNAKGNVPATQFIQYDTDFLDGLEYLNTKSFLEPDQRWSRYMEVWPLDGKLRDGSGTGLGADKFPGNDLNKLEFTPKAEYQSAGLAQPDLSRKKSDLIVVRVTDESVPDAGKKRFATSLSIHGIERAGVEGGTRALEDLVTAHTTGLDDDPVVPRSADPQAPTFAEVLRKSIIYFVYPNPDGWRRGSVTEGGVFFQRYNGNGVDPNRDWPDIGFSFRPYSGLSEPESRGVSSFLQDVKTSTNSKFAAGDDLHGQPFADALSYTLLPHGSHDFGKDLRIRQAAIAIHNASEEALAWSPLIQPNDAPQDDGTRCTPDTPVGTPCQKIYGQTWGTVYDTINYTTTGALGDYFDSSVGMGADGIDNEMSFSHLDKNVNFDPHTEQLHVDGNKSLLYAHLSKIVNPTTGSIDTPGANGFVPNARLRRTAKDFTPAPPAGTEPQTDIAGQVGTFDPQEQAILFPFEVKRTKPVGSTKGIFSGGMRVDLRTENFNGVGTGIAHLSIQCRGCDEHPGVADDDDWVTVSESYNQSPAYLQAGVTAALNRPQPFKKDGGAVEWRARLDGDILNVLSTPPLGVVSKMDVDFTAGRATTDGPSGGDDPAQLRGYDVANTDFLSGLGPFFTNTAERFNPIDPRKVIAGTQSLAGLRSFVLADDPLPGYTGSYAGQQAPSGPPTADFTFDSSGDTFPGGGSGAPGSFERKDFTIGANDLNGKLTIHIDWTNELYDYDLSLYKKESNGDLTQIASDGGSPPSTSEEIVLPGEDGPLPGAGDYVIQVNNYAADNSDDPWTGTVTFDPPAPGSTGPDAGGTGAYTVAQKNAWFAKLKAYAQGGGNLVLTDGAMRALGELTTIPGNKVERGTVYAGQMSFADVSGGDTTGQPLAKNVRQPGSKFNGGDAQKRRQTFEPTPLGFSIQNSETGADESHARQYHVDKAAFTAAGGKVVATSADDGTRAAVADFTRVTLGEIPTGKGRIRIAGALLPQPTAEFDHPLGVEPFAVTYTGYIVFCNLIDCTVSGKAAGSATAASGSAASGPTCVTTRGGIRSTKVGGAALGRTRARQRKLLNGTRFSDRKGIDRYCVRGGGTLRLGYPTKRLNTRLSRKTRRRIASKAVLAISTSKKFSMRKLRVGSSAKAVRRRLKGERSFVIGKNRWYTVPGSKARLLFRTRRGKVVELGIADRRLSVGNAATKRLLRAWDKRG